MANLEILDENNGANWDELLGGSWIVYGEAEQVPYNGNVQGVLKQHPPPPLSTLRTPSSSGSLKQGTPRQGSPLEDGTTLTFDTNGVERFQVGKELGEFKDFLNQFFTTRPKQLSF